MQIQVVPLGAGQDVGRSCVLVTLGGKTIMFDCGIHMGYTDERRCVPSHTALDVRALVLSVLRMGLMGLQLPGLQVHLAQRPVHTGDALAASLMQSTRACVLRGSWWNAGGTGNRRGDRDTLPPGPLRRTAVLHRGARLSRAYLHDLPDQGSGATHAGGLPQGTTAPTLHPSHLLVMDGIFTLGG
jgi:hypothetical protein